MYAEAKQTAFWGPKTRGNPNDPQNARNQPEWGAVMSYQTRGNRAVNFVCFSGGWGESMKW